MFIVMSPPYQVIHPVAGILISTFCSGTTKMGVYTDGNGGTVNQTIETNSVDCGYDPILEGGGGALRVNVAWTGSTDIDIIVTAPDGYVYGYGQSGGGSGKWDHDSTSAGQENVAWNPTAPNGTYTVQLKNYAGNNPSSITVTVILNGVTKTISMTGTLPSQAQALSTRKTQFAIQGGVFVQNPTLV